MQILLAQHGDAIEKGVHPDRPLSEEGRREVVLLGNLLHPLGLNLKTVRHSGKTRARQTAELLLPHVAPRGRLFESPGLAPNDPVAPVARELAQQQEPLLVVGHLPHLARLASLLITGQEERPVVRFQKGSVLCLAPGEAGGWVVAWMLTPEIAAQP